MEQLNPPSQPAGADPRPQSGLGGKYGASQKGPSKCGKHPQKTLDFFDEKRERQYCNFCMYAEKINMNEVVIAEEYCKKWYAEWEQLGNKATRPLDILEKKRNSIGNFYINLESSMDLSFSASQEAGAKQESIKKFIVKLQNVVADARQCNTEQRADKMCELNKQFETYKMKYKACLEQVNQMGPDYIVMQTCLTHKGREKELKLVQDEPNQKQINEFLLKKLQCQNKILLETKVVVETINKDFTKLKEQQERDVKHLEQKIDNFIYSQETQRKTFEAEIMAKLKEMEAKMQTNVAQEVTTQNNGRASADGDKSKKDEQILLNLNKNTLDSEEYVRRAFRAEQVAEFDIGAMLQTTDLDVVVQGWNKEAVVLDANFDKKCTLGIQAEAIQSMTQMGSFLVAHCGVQDRNLIAFDVRENYEKKFQSRTVERSFGALQRCGWEASCQHFVLGMKNGWMSLYQISSVIGGLNEKASKQVFPGKDILCLTEMKQEGIFSVGLQEGGLSIVKVVLGQSQSKVIGQQQQLVMPDIIRLQYHFLREKSITGLIEVRPNMLLAVSHNECRYYLVDLLKFSDSICCQGFSSKAISIVKFPGFNFEKFPIILAKEQEWITILDISNQHCYKLRQVRGHSNNNVLAAQQRIQFLSGATSMQSQYSFITDEDGCHLCNYEISSELVEALRRIHLVART